MTITGFIVRNTFRNKRRSILTVLSIGFSLLLLTLMMTIWRTFYIDQGAPDSAKRLMTRHKVSLTFFLPGFYREKIRSLPGVVYVAPMTWFGGRYKDNKPENFFAQFATDPEEYLKVAADKTVPPDQAEAWIRDRAGAMVDAELAKRYGWKIGDRITLQGTIFPVNPELTIRAIYTMTPANKTLYMHSKYLEEAVSWYKGQTGFYFTRVASPEDIAPTSRAIDDMFRNSPQPTKTESEKAFQLSFIAMLGNVKAFILSICAAVVFAILLVAGQYHGNVHPRTHARSRNAEDSWIYPRHRPLFIRGRGGRTVHRRRTAGSSNRSRAGWVRCPFAVCHRHFVWLESISGHDGRGGCCCRLRGIRQRVLPGLQRLPRQYRGGTAPHRLN